MSKEKAREFLARLSALEAEFNASVEKCDDQTLFVDISKASYQITADYELLDDVRERATPGRFTGEVVDLSTGITLLPTIATPFLKMYDDRKHGIITNITDE